MLRCYDSPKQLPFDSPNLGPAPNPKCHCRQQRLPYDSPKKLPFDSPNRGLLPGSPAALLGAGQSADPPIINVNTAVIMAPAAAAV